MFDESILNSVKTHLCAIFKSSVQAAAEITAVWVCCVNKQIFDTKQYSQICQNLEIVEESEDSTKRKPFFDHPVLVNRILLKMW